MPKVKSDSSLSPEYRALLDKFGPEERDKIQHLFQRALGVVRDLTISDLWEQPELAVTYWILLVSGVNQEEEMEIAKILLVWKAFIAKDSAQVLCIPHSDRQPFKCCSGSFGAVKTPMLILSNDRDMDESIIIDPQLLFTLAAEKGRLQRFLTEIHSSIENGDTLEDINSHLRTERFWAGMKLVYSEIKGLVSIKIG